ncbi:MAG: hypothetical protein A3E87_06620 [Gammaproteobacteria bacterium RIFCSPHIGHO2_12_FULL_35_23]|nr:MAG: hypothetical protein A3E87_06620 [Gammaproteobacteria bacterium RIFCSPHIGHO2_12_FULL_35_23]
MIASNISDFNVVRKEIGISKHFHITHLINPTIFAADNGQIGSVIRLAGVAFDTATNQELNTFKRNWHYAISNLSDDFCLYTYIIRQKLNIQLQGKFKDPFTNQVNIKYHQQFNAKPLYHNSLYIVVAHRGIHSKKFSPSLNFLQRINSRTIKKARNNYQHHVVEKLIKTTTQLITSLKAFQPHLLGSQDESLHYAELLAFLGQFINNNDVIKFSQPTFATPIATSIDNTLKAYALYPFGNIANYLPQKRLFFGKFIEFLDANEASTFASILSIKSYGTTSAPIMFNKLLQLDCEFIFTNSFALEPNSKAQSLINKQIIKLKNANDPAKSQLQELVQCSDDLASDRLKIGYHHNSLLLLSQDLTHLKESINLAVRIYADIGFVAVHETIGQEAAFWAQIPCNQKYIARSTLLTSLNFVDFFPLHNYPIGYRDKNHLGSAVTLIETPSKTPVFFNFHTAGSGDSNDLTPGHTTIIGGNGSGKTVFIGFMDSQMTRYGGRSFFFDRDNGLEIYIRASQGQYTALSANQPIAFNPFTLNDTPLNRSFLQEWFCQLIRMEEEEELPSSLTVMINECINYAFESLAPEHRNLSTVTSLLPINFSRWNQLNRWLKKSGTRPDGEYCYLFDNSFDQLTIDAHKIGFDLTHLLNLSKNVLTVVMMYLFHRIEESLTGQRVSIYLDEGWVYLDNLYWQRKLKQWLPTLRKKNCHIVLATQSPASVVESNLSAQFLDNCATHLFFCNPTANYEKHYKHFNLSSSEFEFIKQTPKEKRLFLYKQASFSVIGKLNLSALKPELNVYSANSKTLRLLHKIRLEMGNDSNVWLPIFQEWCDQL